MSLKKGLLITELMGSSVNLSNGDYSRGASGFWIENGKITYGLSRGDGVYGENITENLLTINDIPTTLLKAPQILEVRGEVYIG